MSIYYKQDSAWSNMALDFYPVGSFYQGDETSPAEMLGGTWTRVFTNPTVYEGLLSNLNNIISSQRWDNINIKGYARGGSILVYIWCSTNTSNILIHPIPNNDAIIGTVDTNWRPEVDTEVVIGYLSDGGWLTLTIRPDGNIYLWSRYSPQNITIAGFGGSISYPVKQLSTNATTVIWKRTA